MALATVSIFTIQLFRFWPVIAFKSGMSAYLPGWIGRWLSVFHCLWVDLSAYIEAALQSLLRGHVSCLWFDSVSFTREEQLLPVYLRIWQWNDLILTWQVILCPGLLPLHPFCWRAQAGSFRRSCVLVTFYYSLWLLREGLGSPSLTHGQGVTDGSVDFMTQFLMPQHFLTFHHSRYVGESEPPVYLRAMWRSGKKHTVGMVFKKVFNLYRLVPAPALAIICNVWSLIHVQIRSLFPHYQTPAVGGALLLLDWPHRPV